MKQNMNILIVGVGGQGVLLASELLSEAALESGYDVKKSEVHGMAQRGGVVNSHVRIGDKIHSPLISAGNVDVILAFEQAEAQRWVHYLKDTGTIIVNRFELIPPIASMKGFNYPADAIGSIKKRVKNVKVINAVQTAERLGNLRLINTILLGVLSLSLNISLETWEKVIHQWVPKGTEELNIKAFFEGRKHY